MLVRAVKKYITMFICLIWLTFKGIKFLMSSSAAFKDLKLNVNIYVWTYLREFSQLQRCEKLFALYLISFLHTFVFVPTDNR